jgi:hypothetical protein
LRAGGAGIESDCEAGLRAGHAAEWRAPRFIDVIARKEV